MTRSVASKGDIKHGSLKIIIQRLQVWIFPVGWPYELLAIKGDFKCGLLDIYSIYMVVINKYSQSSFAMSPTVAPLRPCFGEAVVQCRLRLR